MPRLQILAACREVTVDSEDNSPSLVKIFGSLFMTDLPKPIPEKLGYNMMWHACSVWRRLPEDDGKSWLFQIEILNPEKKQIGESASGALVMDDVLVTARVRADTFPVAIAGTYYLRASYKEENSTDDWIYGGEFPVEVAHESSDEVEPFPSVG